MLDVFLAVAITVNSAAAPPTVTFTAADGRVEVAGSVPRWIGFTASAAEAKVTDGWLVLVGTEQQPVELRLPWHHRKYLIQRIEFRLSDGTVKCPAGPATAYPLK